MALLKAVVDSTGVEVGVRQVRSALKRMRDDVRKTDQNLDKMGHGGSRALSVLRSSVLGAASAIGIFMTYIQVADIGRFIMDVQRLKVGMEAATGGAVAASREFAFLREESDRLGLSFQGQVKGYRSIVAASRGTILEGQATRDIFLGISEAAAALQLSIDDTNGILLATQQIMSKGTVQAEELRGQIGERLPGAFQVASKAMGMTTAELGDFMKKGLLTATDFLPKFAAALREHYSGALDKATDTLAANLNRLQNAWHDFKITLVDAAPIETATNLLKGLTAEIKAANETINRVGTKQGREGMMDRLLAKKEARESGEQGILWSQKRADIEARQVQDLQREYDDLWERYKRFYHEHGKMTVAQGRAFAKMAAELRDLKAEIQDTSKNWNEAFAEGKIADAAIGDIEKQVGDQVQMMGQLAEVGKELDRMSDEFWKPDEAAIKVNLAGYEALAEKAKAAAEAIKKAAEEKKRIDDAYKASLEAARDYDLEDMWLVREKGMEAAHWRSIDMMNEEAQIAEDLAKEAAEKSEQAYKDFYENTVSTASDVFFDLFSDMENGYKGVLDRMRNWFLRLLSDMAAQALAKPIIMPMVQGFYGGSMAAGGQGEAGAGMSMQGLSQIGSMGSRFMPGVSNFLSTPAWGGAAAGSMGGYGGFAGLGIGNPGSYGGFTPMAGPSWGAIGAAGMIGSLGYTTLGSMIGLPQGQYSGLGAGVGSALGYAGGAALGSSAMLSGTMMGSWAGPIGMAAGAIIGGLVGALGGGEQKDWKVELNRPMGMGFSDDWMSIPFEHRRGGDPDIQDRLEQGFEQLRSSWFNTAMSMVDMLPAEVQADLQEAIESADITLGGQGWTVRMSHIEDDLEAIFDAVGTSIWSTISPILMPSINEMVNGFDFSRMASDSPMQGLLEGFNAGVQDGDIEGYVENIQALMTAISQADAAWNQAYDSIENIVNPLSTFDSTMQNLESQFENQIITLDALGFSEEALNQMREKQSELMDYMLEQFAEQRAQVISEASDYVAGLSESSNQMADEISDLESQFAAYKEQVIDLGGAEEDLSEIERLRLEGISAIEEKYQGMRLDILAESADYLATFTENMTQSEQAMADMNQEFDALVEAMTAAGGAASDLAQIESDRAEAESAIAENFSGMRQDVLAEAGDFIVGLTENLSPLESQIQDTNRQFDRMRDELLDIGDAEAELTALEALRAEAILALIAAQRQADLQLIEQARADITGTADDYRLQQIAGRYGWGAEYYSESGGANWRNIFEDSIQQFAIQAGEKILAAAEGFGVPVSQLVDDVKWLNDAINRMREEIQRAVNHIRANIDSVRQSPEYLGYDTGSASFFMSQIQGAMSGSTFSLQDLMGISDDLVSWWNAAIQEEIALAQKMEAAANAIESLINQIDNLINSIVYSDLNISLPGQKAQSAQSTYEALRAKVFGPGAEPTQADIQAYLSFAQTYLQQQQNAFMSSEEYEEIYDRVMAELLEARNLVSSESFEERLLEEMSQLNENIDIEGLRSTFEQIAAWLEEQMGEVENGFTIGIDFEGLDENAAASLAMLSQVIEAEGWNSTVTMDFIAEVISGGSNILWHEFRDFLEDMGAPATTLRTIRAQYDQLSSDMSWEELQVIFASQGLAEPIIQELKARYVADGNLPLSTLEYILRQSGIDESLIRTIKAEITGQVEANLANLTIAETPYDQYIADMANTMENLFKGMVSTGNYNVMGRMYNLIKSDADGHLYNISRNTLLVSDSIRTGNSYLSGIRSYLGGTQIGKLSSMDRSLGIIASRQSSSAMATSMIDGGRAPAGLEYLGGDSTESDELKKQTALLEEIASKPKQVTVQIGNQEFDGYIDERADKVVVKRNLGGYTTKPML